MNLVALLAAEALDADQVREVLRHDAFPITFGVLFLAVGLAGLAISAWRRKSRDPALVWFGLFSVLYGFRLLLDTRTTIFTLGMGRPFLRFLIPAITYSISVPAILFLRETIPPWKRVLTWLLWGQAVFAVAGIVADFATGTPESLRAVNNLIVIATNVIFVAALFFGDSLPVKVRILKIGVLALMFTVLLNNVASLGLFPLSFNPEPLGFAVFVISLGQVILQRTSENEERLLALDKELEIARRIQLSILPRETPQTAHVSVAARYLPMTAVAGDFYEFLVIDEKRLGILVADVSGHGVPAALIASMVKVAIASQLPHADDPARVMAGMNQTLCGKLQGQFVTAAYLFLDFESSTLRYAAAGHPPLMWWRSAEKSVESVTENGLILGLLPMAAYTSIERAFAPGDRFLMYTDGLLEAANASDEFFGEDRVRAGLRASAAMNAEQYATSVVQDLAHFAGHDAGRSPDDDLTVVVADVRPATKSYL